jgi:chemotaxis protein CheD
MSTALAMHTHSTLTPMGQMSLYSRTGERLCTRALGSCVAVMLRDIHGRAGGLAHCMLPLSQLDADCARKEPCTFTDSGIACLRNALIAGPVPCLELQAFIVGGACLLGTITGAQMGQRNVAVARMLLDQLEIPLAGERVGGQMPRSVIFAPEEGWVEIFCAGETERVDWV